MKTFARLDKAEIDELLEALNTQVTRNTYCLRVWIDDKLDKGIKFKVDNHTWTPAFGSIEVTD
jgi:hypothetical protein